MGIKGADSRGGAVYYIVRSQVYRQLDAGMGVRSLDALLESGLCGASIKGSLSLLSYPYACLPAE